MGLDISLLRIEEKQVTDLGWLIANDSPELERCFSAYKKSKYFEYEGSGYFSDVYYYSELSYQRKGVIKEFYQVQRRFESCIDNREELNQLYNFIDSDHKDSFKTNFIDQFEEGRMFILVDW